MALVALVCIAPALPRVAARDADTARVRVTSASTPVRVGDVVTLELTVDGGDASRLELPALPAGVEPVAAPERIDQPSDEGATAAVRWQVRAFTTGRITVPPIGLGRGVRTDPIAIDVAPLTDAATQPEAAKLVFSPVRSFPLVPVVLLSMLGTFVAFRIARTLAGRPVPGELALIRALWPSRRERAALEDPLVARQQDPATAALEALETLVSATANGYDAEESYDRLAAVVVWYVERSYGLTRRARTTGELLRVIRAKADPKLAGRYASLLRTCDRVKFAAEAPARSVFRRDVDEAVGAIRSAEP